MTAFFFDMVDEAGIAPAGCCFFALAGGLVFSILCKGRVVVRVLAEVPQTKTGVSSFIFLRGGYSAT